MQYENKISLIILNLFVSSRSVACNEKILNNSKIKFVLTIHEKPLEQKSKDIEYKFVFSDDDGNGLNGSRLCDNYDELFSWIDEKRNLGNVLIHCHQGFNRSISVILAFLVKKYKITLQKAIRYVEKKRLVNLAEEIETDLKSWVDK